MLSNWLKYLFRPKPAAKLTAIFIAAGAGKPMQALSSAKAIQGSGLSGDRYHDNTGHWRVLEACQVTLISEDELQRAQKKTPIPLNNGSHRRNLVIAGINPRSLEGQRFSIGEAIFEYQKPRPPCGYIDQVAGKGIGRALSRNSGICVRVLRTGALKIGNPIEIIAHNNPRFCS